MAKEEHCRQARARDSYRSGSHFIRGALSRPLCVEMHRLELVQTAKVGSLIDVNASDDPEGLRVFYYLIQDLRVRSLPACLTA